MPFDQPWHRETTMVGTMFDMTMINSVCMKDDGVEFLTCSTMPAMGAPLVPSCNKCMLYLFWLKTLFSTLPSFAFLMVASFLDPSPTKPTACSNSNAPSLSKSITNSWPHSPSKPATLLSCNQHGYYHCLGFSDEGVSSALLWSYWSSSSSQFLSSMVTLPMADTSSFTMKISTTLHLCCCICLAKILIGSHWFQLVILCLFGVLVRIRTPAFCSMFSL